MLGRSDRAGVSMTTNDVKQKVIEALGSIGCAVPSDDATLELAELLLT